jgi:hypothetical protein
MRTAFRHDEMALARPIRRCNRWHHGAVVTFVAISFNAAYIASTAGFAASRKRCRRVI